MVSDSGVKAWPQASPDAHAGLRGLREPAFRRSGGVQRRRIDHYAILIGIQPVAWTHPYAKQLDGDIALALTTLDGGQRYEAQSTNPHRGASEFSRIAHAAIDDDTCPSICRSGRRKVAPHEGPAQRPATIDHQHPAFAGGVECSLYQCVVFKTLDGANGPTKDAPASK